MPTEPKKPLIVISYAHADEPDQPAEGEVKWLSFVTGYLRPAIKHGAVDLWLDRLMPLGANWEPEIEKKFRACDIFILLVSRHSLSSNYVVDKEIPIIRARQANGEAVHFYPLVLTPTPKAGLRLVSDKNLRPRDGKPLSDYPLHERYRHMAEAADEIAEIAAEIQSRKTLAPAQPSLDTASILGARQDGSLDQSKAKPRNLPFASLGGLFAGRDEDLADLHTALLAPRAPRSRFTVSGGSARRGSRSNMRGLARRSIRRFCSSARATAPRSMRVWRGLRPSRISTCRRKRRATTRPRSLPSCAGLRPTRHG
jgi:hypothetical protein